MSSERQEGGDDTPTYLIISPRGLFVNGRGDVYLFKQDLESSTGKSPSGRGFCFYVRPLWLGEHTVPLH